MAGSSGPAGQLLSADSCGTSGLRGMREAIRGALAAHTDRVKNPAAASRLTVALAPCRLGLAVDPACDTRLVSADHDPFPRVIGAVAVAIAEAAVGGTWARLKSCPGHLCGWAFYDRSASGQSGGVPCNSAAHARRCALTGDGWHSELPDSVTRGRRSCRAGGTS